jgi:hypothetical protein
VLSLFALGDKSAEAQGCSATACTSQSARDRGERALHEANAATVGFVAGAVLLGAGAVLFFTSRSGSASASLGVTSLQATF